MAASRGFGWGAFLLGALTLLILLVAIAAIVIFGGFYPIAASQPDPPGFAWLLSSASDHAVERQSAGLNAPNFSAADIREGAGHFKGMCQRCHGGPGVSREDFATGLNPQPPNLAESTDDMSVGQVFWIAKHGIKMTAMPAFGKSDSDDELWKVAAFVKQMSKMTPQQYAAIPNAHEMEHGGKGGD
jgi:mono/diheme cytochrome c family protein